MKRHDIALSFPNEYAVNAFDCAAPEEGHQLLRRQIATGENACTAFQFEEMCRLQATDFLQPGEIADRWTRYAQILLASNEMMYVD